MTRGQVAAFAAMAGTLIWSVGWGAFEMHRARVAAEESRDAEQAIVELAAETRDSTRAMASLIADSVKSSPREQHAMCPKEASHLDHDVDMGRILPCPNPADGQCVGGVAMSVAEAHCRAGKP